MGNAESKAAARLEAVLPHANNYFRRRDLIKNTILLVKTDPSLSPLLGLDAGDQATQSTAKTWSFEYLVAAAGRGDSSTTINTNDMATSETPTDGKQNYTATIALLVDNVFRWKVEAVVSNADRRDEIALQTRATEALGDVVDALLAERLRGVYHFVRGAEGRDGGAEVASTLIATPLSSPPLSSVMGELPRYEDVKR